MDFSVSQQCLSQSVGTFNQILSTLVHTLIERHCNLSPPENWPKDYGATILQKGSKEYDFVIVGGGTTGSIAAYRLSQYFPNSSILLLSTSGNPPSESESPYFPNSLKNTKIVEFLHGEISENFARGLPEGVRFPISNVLGGASSVDDSFYIRGTPKDFNKWENLGNSGWNYKNLLKYFKKSEDLRAKDQFTNYTLIHGSGGPISVDRFNYQNEAKNILTAALAEKGYPEILDFNTEPISGWTEILGCLSDGHRTSTAKGYLIPAGKRPNVRIVKGVKKNRLILSENAEEKVRVAGVGFQVRGKEVVATAKNEYILAEGIFSTNQLLLESGIGNETELKRLGIKTKRNLPGVGKHLITQLFVPIFVKYPCDPEKSVLRTITDYFQYLTTSKGRYASSYTSDLLHFIKVNNETGGTAPDLYYTFVPHDRNNSAFLVKSLQGFGYGDDIINQLKEAITDSCLIQVNVNLPRPKSRGSITLKKKNARLQEALKIYPNFFDKIQDLEKLKKGIQIFKELFGTETFKNNAVADLNLKIDQCKNFTSDSDEYLECYCRYLTTTNSQISGSTKLGNIKIDKDAVVDNNLLVHGVKNLRILSASVFPTAIIGQVATNLVAITERACDLIKKKWQK